MGITKYLDDIKDDFEIYGQLENGWEDFRKDVDYESFIVNLKGY
jgi:hypothetical protein